jgi:hypothetical protein
MSGLEHGFLSAFIIILLHYSVKKIDRKTLLFLSLLSSIIILIRIDAPLLIFILYCSLYILNFKNNDIKRKLAFSALLPLSILILQIIFRITYYGKLLPHTGSVKISFNYLRLELGYKYVLSGIYNTWSLWALAFVSILFLCYNKKYHYIILPISLCISWLAYLSIIGGDIFYARRQFVISYIPLFIIISLAFDVISSFKLQKIIFLVIFIPLTLVYFYLNINDDQNFERIKKYTWIMDSKVIGEKLNIAFKRHNPILAVDAAGALPYYTKFKSYDMLGLTNHEILENSKVHGTQSIGHEIGNGDVVMRQKPDIISFNSALGSRKPSYRSGKQFFFKNEFKDNYKLVVITEKAFLSNKNIFAYYYFKYRNSAIGINGKETSRIIPGYFFRTKLNSIFSNQYLMSLFNFNEYSVMENVKLNKGIWTCKSEPESKFEVTISIPKGRYFKNKIVLKNENLVNLKVRSKAEHSLLNYVKCNKINDI